MLSSCFCGFHMVTISTRSETRALLILNRQHSEGRLSFPTAQDSQLLGFCTGAFAAAAISSSQDLVQLIPAAVHATVISLHTGLRSAQEALSIDSSISSSQCSIFVRGVSRDDVVVLLERFNSKNVSLFRRYAATHIAFQRRMNQTDIVFRRRHHLHMRTSAPSRPPD